MPSEVEYGVDLYFSYQCTPFKNLNHKSIPNLKENHRVEFLRLYPQIFTWGFFVPGIVIFIVYLF